MDHLDKYFSENRVRRSRIAIDSANGTLSSEEIRSLCDNPKVKDVFIGETYNKKVPKEQWNAKYLDRLVCAAVAESFNEDYLLYLAEVGSYVRRKKAARKRRKILGIIAVVAIIAAIVGVVIWATYHAGTSATVTVIAVIVVNSSYSW